MALELRLSISEYAADRTSLTLIDATGIYNVDTNPGGYGTPNPDRADIALFISAEKVDSNSVASPITMSNTDSENITEWNLNLDNLDGWYRSTLVGIPDYDNAVTYNLYDVVYDTGVVYRAVDDNFSGQAPPDSLFWEVISDPVSLVVNIGETNESLNLHYTIFNTIIMINSEYAFANLISDVAIEACNDCDVEDEVELYENVAILIDGAAVACSRQLYSRGEVITRKIEELTS